MREERADLRAQVYVMDQEKKSLELLINSQKSQEMALKTHIQHLQEELENQESLVMQLTFKRQFTQDSVRLERSSLVRSSRLEPNREPNFLQVPWFALGLFAPSLRCPVIDSNYSTMYHHNLRKIWVGHEPMTSKKLIYAHFSA